MSKRLASVPTRPLRTADPTTITTITYTEVPVGPQTAKIPSPQSIAAILSPTETPPSIDTPSASTPKRAHAEAFPEADTELFLRPASPVRKRPSPENHIIDRRTSSAGVANEDGGSGAHNETEGKKPAKMRSSIACSRCRRSKIKCVNNGIDTVCRACETTGRECVYPPPAPGQSAAPKRTEVSGGLKNDGEAEFKRARKRETDAVRKQSIRHGEDPLGSPQMTAKLWKDVYNAFMLHCSAELPFLHEEVFHSRATLPTTERSPDIQIFLLGMLALTARFIPELVAHHNVADPLVASEFYAEAFASRLDAPALTGPPSLERLQGLLMISLYHWGMCRGQRAWMYITIAIGMAQVMGLMFEEEPGPEDKSARPSLLEEARQLGVRPKTLEPRPKSDDQAVILREIKRRTAYSCFILDRYQASGRYRPQCINIDDLNVQLPCSEEDFRFGVPVKTGFLKDNIGRFDNPETSPDPGIATTQVLSIYIRLVEIWGRFSRWSCKGGRRTEQYPPWDSRTEFYKLRKQLDAFHESLPPKLTFSPTKVARHIGGGTLTLYTAIHTLYSLCRIVLHREYIPFIPLRCSGPSGPLDEPMFPKEKYDVPEGFWEESAEHIFKAARDIMEIVRVTADRQVLVESPQVGFAIWTAAFVGVSSCNFPHMDQQSYMCDKPLNAERGNLDEDWKGATGLAVRTLNQMKPKSKMACGWSFWIYRMHRYFQGIKQDHNRSIMELNLPSSEYQRRVAAARELSLREGGHGGGLDEYKLLEKELKDFGPSIEQDRYDSPEARNSPFSRSSTRGGAASYVKIEANSERPPTRNGAEGSWAAVNTTAPNGAEDYQMPNAIGYPAQSPSNGLHSTTYYPRAPTSNPPSLMGSGPRSTPSDLNSPYARNDVVMNGTGPPFARKQSGGGGETYGAQGVQINEDPLEKFEHISHYGVDIQGFASGMPYQYWGDAAMDGRPLTSNMNINFMQAVAGMPGGCVMEGFIQ